ncbi:MAG: hypothetical protein Q4C67_10960, partial [Deinococcus sp.]|nr:hypothetical protein [Deinococcus sp.]
MSLFHSEVMEFPSSPPGRLIPVRLFLFGYWLYGMQVFQFVKGRLFLTGHNGSGKSTALTAAVTLLLDGDSSPHRLDAFGGRQRNLSYYLLGDADAGFKHESRTAYLALEFVTSAGDHQTVGLGLRASRGYQGTDKWGFWLPGRIALNDGEDGLRLLEHRVPLTRKMLRERLGPLGGEFADGQREYAELVRRRVYGGSVRDVQETIDLLLDVRGSKLGNEKRLAAAADQLRRALPPVARTVTDKLADGVESLSRHAHRLEVLERQTEAARTVAQAHYVAALAVARQAAGELAQAGKRAEVAGGTLREAEGQRERLAAAVVRLDTELQQSRHEAEQLGTEIETVQAQVSGQQNVLGETERRLKEAETLFERYRGKIRSLQTRQERQTQTLAAEETRRERLAAELGRLQAA